MSDSVLSASAKGATFLILLQAGSRALTFIINQVLLRFLSPEIFGIATQLELYSISVLYFSRDSLRVALQRQSGDIQAVINLSYLAIFIGVPLSYVLARLYSKTVVFDVPYLGHSLWLYGLASVIELFAEPAFVAIQHKLLYKIRASAETIATITRCVLTCGCAIWASKAGIDVGVLPFALGQLGYAAVLLSVYTVRLWTISAQGSFSLLLKRVANSDSHRYIASRFSWALCKLSLSLYLQSSIKYILTQGDSLLIATLAPLRDQGAYALASNYGGLVARMLFQPIEESSRNLFAKLCASQQPSQKPPAEGIRQARTVLQDILKFYNLISLVACALGPTIAPLLLEVVVGARWADTDAGGVLATYCYYIPLLALNGVTEAFVAAVASNAELHTQSIYMGAFFAAFAGAAYLFLQTLHLGAQGLVYANYVNMTLRIAWNIRFIKRFFKWNSDGFTYNATLPSTLSIAAAVAVPSVLKATSRTAVRYGLLGELFRAGTIAAAFALLLLYGATIPDTLLSYVQTKSKHKGQEQIADS